MKPITHRLLYLILPAVIFLLSGCEGTFYVVGTTGAAFDNLFSEITEIRASNSNTFEKCVVGEHCEQSLYIISPASHQIPYCKWIDNASGTPAGLKVRIRTEQYCYSKHGFRKCTYLEIEGVPEKAGFYEWEIVCGCCRTMFDLSRSSGKFRIQILEKKESE